MEVEAMSDALEEAELTGGGAICCRDMTAL